jgi:multiple sugar transport system permease protein
VTVSRGRALIGLASFVVAAAALGTGLSIAVRAVREAERARLRAEADIGVGLLAETGDRGALDRLFGDRWATRPEIDPLLDRAVVVETATGPVARATLYAADGWTRVGTLQLRPPRGGPLHLPGAVIAIALAAGLLLAGACLSWASGVAAAHTGTAARRGPGTRLRRWGPGLLVGTLLAVPLALAARWAERSLRSETDARMAAAVEALESALDVTDLIRRPGGVTALTGLPFLVQGDTAPVDHSTLLPGVAAALRSVPTPPPPRVTVARVPYALADAGSVRLAMIPYEHTRDPTAALAGIALAGLLLAALPLALAPLADDRRRLRRNLTAWGFLAPAALLLAVFTIGPLVFAGWLSLHRWNLVDAARPFVGLANYAELLQDRGFWRAILNTVVFTLHVPVAMALALALALWVRRPTRGVLALRAAFFLPSITSLVAIAIVWQWMLNDQYGLINWGLSRLGLGPVHWLTSPRTALLSIMILSIWIVVGYQVVLFQAGLSTIPQELYDAARIDGAGPWRIFRRIALPLASGVGSDT